MGQHHRRRRADPAGRRRQGPRVRDAPGDQARRHQVRQDRGRRAVARPRDDVAVRLPPVLAQRRRLAGEPAAADLHVPAATRSRRSRPRRAEKPWLRAGQKRLADEVTTLVHGAEETEQAKAAAAALFGGGDLHALSPARSPPRCARPGRRSVSSLRPVVDLMVETGLAKSRGEARRTINRGRRLPQQRTGRGPRGRAAAERPDRRLLARAAAGQESFAGIEVG